MSSDAFDEVACLRRVRERDEAACRELVDHLYPVVIRIVRAHLPRRDAEEDLAQEVFMKMFARLDQYREKVPLEHWVSRIAVTTCYDKLRAQRRRPELRRADLTEEESERIDRVADTGNATAIEAFAARELVEQLLARLNPRDRHVINLLELEQRSIEEIRQITGWNSSLIKVRAFRARQKLRKEWERMEKSEERR
ncbi:MAG: RNA polymerase sigma factor [Verrucomicrobiota bacterium]|nr:RNA polymerase sigma factor [Verrucomicrobiota bacterium]